MTHVHLCHDVKASTEILVHSGPDVLVQHSIHESEILEMLYVLN